MIHRMGRFAESSERMGLVLVIVAAALVAGARAGYTIQSWECSQLDSSTTGANQTNWSFYAVTPSGMNVCEKHVQISGTYNQIISQGSTATFCSQTSAYSDIAPDNTIAVSSSNGSYLCDPATASTLDFRNCNRGANVTCVVSQAYICPTGKVCT